MVFDSNGQLRSVELLPYPNYVPTLQMVFSETLALCGICRFFSHFHFQSRWLKSQWPPLSPALDLLHLAPILNFELAQTYKIPWFLWQVLYDRWNIWWTILRWTVSSRSGVWNLRFGQSQWPYFRHQTGNWSMETRPLRESLLLKTCEQNILSKGKLEP